MSSALTHRLRQATDPLAVHEASLVVDGCRSIKSDAELAPFQQAKSMTLEVQRRTALILEPGMRASTVRRFINEARQALGAGGHSFCIVQFSRSTAFPHGLPDDPYISFGFRPMLQIGQVCSKPLSLHHVGRG